MRNFLAKYVLFIILIIFFLIATVNLLHSGFPLTHDGDVHLMRLTGFYQSLEEGIWIPRWAAYVNWGYGQPVFEFFYPLPSYIASSFHVLGISFANSLKILLGTSLVLSGLSMYYFLSHISDKFGSFIGAFLYVFAPYRFVDLYVRGDIGENLALIFIPLVLVNIYFLSKKQYIFSFIFAGIFLAALILSHNIVSLMALPVIFLYAFSLFFGVKNRKEFIIRIALVIALGFLLSAFFWLPGLFEGKYTLRDIVTKGAYVQNFTSISALFWGPWSYGISGQFTTQLGVFQWFALALGCFSLFFFKSNKKILLIGGLCLYAIVSIALMLPISTSIWSRAVLLENFQFPWRFLIVTTLTTSIMSGVIALQFSPKVKIGIIIFLILGTILLEHDYWHAKAYVSRPDSFFEGIIDAPSDTGESTPIWGVRFMEHRFSSPLEVLSGQAHIVVGKREIAQHLYTVQVSKQAVLMENTLYFPGWNILVDGKKAAVEFQNQQHRGLMIFSVSPGMHIIEVLFTETKFRLFADWLSIAGLLGVAVLFIIQSKRHIL